MPPNWTKIKEALFWEYPKVRKSFVSLPNLDIFVKDILDEYATFHREFRRLPA